MKAAPLALCLVWAAPVAADVAVPRPPKKTSWSEQCAARLDAQATKRGLMSHARVSTVPLRNEDGVETRVRYVEYATPMFSATVGEDTEPHADSKWKRTGGGVAQNLFDEEIVRASMWFRRVHNRFAKLEGTFSSATEREFKAALDECLNMGDSR